MSKAKEAVIHAALDLIRSYEKAGVVYTQRERQRRLNRLIAAANAYEKSRDPGYVEVTLS